MTSARLPILTEPGPRSPFRHGPRGLAVASLRKRARPLLVPGAVAFLTAAVYTIFSTAQWRAYATPSWDLGIFTQLARQYAALQPPIVTIKGDGFNLLGDHFHPLLVLLGPVYAMFPHAFTLVVVQNLLFGLAAGVITFAATRVARLGPLGGALVGLAFGFSWGLQGAVAVQFHEIAFAVPLLAVSLSAFVAGRWVMCAVWAAPLVFVKEDLGLTVAVIGVLLAWRACRPLGLWLASWGFAWFAVATLLVLPLLNSNGRWAYTGSIDLAGLLADPASVIHPDKAVTLGLLVIASGAIALRSPLILVALPTLGWRFLSDNAGYWGHGWQYSAVLMPVIFCAALDAIVLGRERPGWLRRCARWVPAVMAAVAALLVPQLPLAKLGDMSVHFSTDRAAAASAALDAVPDDAVVESDIGLMTYLVDRTEVYWVGNDNPTPDYIVVDLFAGGLPAEWTSVTDVQAERHPGVAFRTVYSGGGYEVAARAGLSQYSAVSP